jgi:hypothetical protein
MAATWGFGRHFGFDLFVLGSCGGAIIGEDSRRESGPPHLSLSLIGQVSTVKFKGSYDH